jgi:predicted metalloprotease with PDZ domain
MSERSPAKLWCAPYRALLVPLLFLVFAAQLWAASPSTRYTISLARASEHLVNIRINLPPGSTERELQLPVWNALYQVRDFSQYVSWVRARNESGQPLALRKVNTSRWHLAGAENGAEVEYQIFCNQPGPYDAELNLHHAFFNLAEILMYPVDARSLPMQVQLRDVPGGWRTATSLLHDPEEAYTADNYDRLVDSPLEIGTFDESDFDAEGRHYRVVIDAERGTYDMQKTVAMVRAIVTAATQWMNDGPFETYLFLYHFSHEGSFGGMEHAYSTAISMDARTMNDDPQRLADVTAHEFFHLWNVKRIRPQSLEPVDYTKENYTRALWFCEGTTSSAQDFILLRAGLLEEKRFLDRLGNQITTLQRRPAHLTQSVEESSLDAWLEKYAYYRLPERSISYYNKGDLVGVLLDLQLRKASHGRVSLRELFQWMNENFAKKGRYFADSQGVQMAAEALAHVTMVDFFEKYVAGTQEIPWNDFFNGVGLRVEKHVIPVSDLGFAADRAFGSPPAVTRVTANSAAEQQGLTVGDVLVEINGQPASADFASQLAVLQPGSTIELRVRNELGERHLMWKLTTREDIEYQLRDLESMTAQQKTRRAAWLKGQAERGEPR